MYTLHVLCFPHSSYHLQISLLQFHTQPCDGSHIFLNFFFELQKAFFLSCPGFKPPFSPTKKKLFAGSFTFFTPPERIVFWATIYASTMHQANKNQIHECKLLFDRFIMKFIKENTKKGRWDCYARLPRLWRDSWILNDTLESCLKRRLEG